MLSCLDTKSENVKKWFATVGKEMTYQQFLIHNYFLPNFEEFSSNKNILEISKIREVLKDILPTEQFDFKPIDLLEIADPKAEGAFYKDVLYFASQADKYTAYEEGFHAIYQRLIPTELKEDVQKAGKALLEKRLKKEGISLKDYLSKYPSLDYGIEEEIAKEFINYKLYNSSGFLDRKQNIEKLSFLGKLAEPIVKFFEWLSSFFNNVQNNKQKLQSLFDLINSGAFSSSVKMGNTQYEFPSYRIIVLDNNRTLNQKEQANIYSGIKSIYKEIKSGDINQDIEIAIELYRTQVTQDDIIKEKILPKETLNTLTKKLKPNDKYKDVFEDIKKQIEDSKILTEEEDEEGEDAIQAQINGSSDKDSEKSAIERLSKYTRDYISNIGGVVKIINYNNKPIFVKSYIEINNVYSSIVRNLANTPDFYTKLKKLVQLSDDNKSKDTKVFVDQFLQDLFLDSYEGYSVEEYIEKRDSALTELKIKIKSRSGFSFGHSKDGVLIDTDFFEDTHTLYLSPKAANKANQILKSFDLYTADVVQQLVDYENGNVISYDPHKASIVLPQLDEWRNNYTNVQYSKIESTNLKSKTVKSFQKDFLDKLGIDISDGYVKFLLGKSLNESEDYIDFATEFDNIPEDAILTQEDVDTILRFHNDGKDLYSIPKEGEEDESVITRLKKIARGNAYFDESVLESTYQDAEGKYIYAHQNKTFNLNLANVIKSGVTWSTDSLKEIKDERVKNVVKNFHEKNPIQKTINKGITFDKLGRFRYTGFRQEDRDDKGNKVEKDNQTNVSFKGITAEDFDVAKLNLAVSQTKWIKYLEEGRERHSLIVPQFVGHFETANTAEFQYMEFIRSLNDKGNLTADVENQFVEYIQSEYDRFQDYVTRLIESNLLDLEDGNKSIKITTKMLLSAGWKSAIDGYHTGTINYSVANGIIEFNKGNLPRALQLSTELNAFSSLFSTTYNTDKENPSKLYENLQDFKREVNKVYLINLEKQVKDLNQPGFEKKLSKLFTGNYSSLTKAEQAIVHVLGFSKNLHYNLKQYIANYELNAIGYNRFVYGDMLIFNKNDMSDLFKRNKGSNAAIVSAYSEFLNLDLGIDKIFKEIKTITHDEVEGTSSTDGKSIDSMDAQALASIQHTRHLLYGLGRLTPMEAKLLTKMHNGEEYSQEDKKWMFTNDTFLSANKTVSYTDLQFVKISEAYTGTLSKRNTSIPIEINITEQEYLSLVNITPDGRIYPKVDSNVEVTKIGDKYFKWEATKDRKGLHAKRLMLEGWRKEKGEWIYKGRNYEAGLIFPKSASKRMIQNSVGLIDNEPDFDSFTENNLNTLSAGQYGLQVENQGIKDKITDPSQNIEIITNELGEVIITNYVTGEQSKPISAADFTTTFQNLLAKRDKTSFGQAYKELVNKNGGAIYKYLFELIKAGVDETSSDPQLQQLIQVDTQGNYVYNLNIPLFQQKFQQYLFAYMTKGVLAQKRAGDALVMTSPHGHNLLKKLVVIKDKKDKIIDYSWRVVQRHTQEYKDNINQAEERFVDLIYKKGGTWYDKMDTTFKEKGEVYFIDEVRHAVPEYKDGKVIGKFSESLMGKWDLNHKDIQKSFMYMFGVRIPSQDKQSSLNIKLVDWLEDGAGNAIVVPKEYQQLSGADYDVDKIYTYKQEGYWNGDKFIQYTNSKNEAENYLQWRKYYFKDNKTAKKLKRSLLDENSYYTDLKRDYQSFISYKNQVLKNLDLPQEESDIIESIEAQQEFIQEVSKDKRKKEYKFIDSYKKQLKELEDKLSDINSVKEYLENKKRFNERLGDLRNELLSIEFSTESQVLEELQLPSTITEFKDSDIINNAVLNNELLAMFQSAISSPKMTEKISVKNVPIEESPYTEEGYELYQEKVNKGIHETGTSVDWLKKADKYYKSLEGIEFNSDNKEFGIRSIRTDYKYFKGSQGGKKGIGSAVNNMLASLTWKKVNNYNLGINLNQEDLLGISKYQDTTEDGLERTADNSSTQTTATTDEAKEQALAKYNIRGKALDVFATALALGYRIDQAILLVNVPLVQEYLDDRSVGKFDEKFVPVSYTQEDLANILRNKDLNQKAIEESALFDFIQIEKQAEINSNLMQFVKLKRGYKPEYSAFETVIEAGNKLGFGNLPGLEDVYGKNEKPLFNFSKILQDNKESLKQLYQNVTEIVPKTKEVTEKFLLVANPEYKGLVNNLNANTKFGVDKLKLGKEIQTWLISNYLNNPINTDILFGENSLAKQLQKTDVTDNALVNHLNSLINKDGFDQIAIKAFSRLKADKQESLIDGFNVLMIDPKTQPLALAIYNYFGIKDGFLYKPNSISKVLPVHMFKEMSDSVDKFLQDSLSFQDRNKVIEDILTDISNKNLLVNAREGKINGEVLIPSTFNIQGKEIPITITTQYTNKKGETKQNTINVEYTVDSEKTLPNFVKIYNNLYKKFPISETKVKYVVVPFYGNSKFKIQTTKEKIIFSNDYQLAQSLLNGFKNDKGETKEGRYVTLAKKDSDYSTLLKEYAPALNRTKVVETTYSEVEEGEEKLRDEKVIDVSEIKMENNLTKNIYAKLGNKTVSNNVVIKSWNELKDATKAIIPEGIISTRIKMSTGHFGNPFTSDTRLQNLIQTKSTKESVERYINWILTGETGEVVFTGIQPEELETQRDWILKQLKSEELKGKPILYYKELGEPSHATALDYLIQNWEQINNLTSEQQFPKLNLFTVEPIQSVDKKAKIKASVATQYIGFGEGIKGSSTDLYSKQAGKYANTGNYSNKDIIFVSIGGKRGTEIQQKEQQDRTIKEALKAIELGAVLITDNKNYIESNSYNTGEKRLYKNLESKGYKYSEQTIDGEKIGVWNNSTIPVEQPKKEQISLIEKYGDLNFKNLSNQEITDLNHKLKNSKSSLKKETEEENPGCTKTLK